MLRNKDYAVLYAGNSPARVHALENNVIQAAAFSANERVAMEQKGYPLILETGKVIPEIPFDKVKGYPAGFRVCSPPNPRAARENDCEV